MPNQSEENVMNAWRTDIQHPVTQRDGLSAMKTLLAGIGVTIALVAPALAQDARSIANEANGKWLQAYNKGDAAALTALYTKDAVLSANDCGTCCRRAQHTKILRQRCPA